LAIFQTCIILLVFKSFGQIARSSISSMVLQLFLG
jgi:hypothetical protein